MKKVERVLLLQRCFKISQAVYPLHNVTCISNVRGENEGLAPLFATIMSLNTKKKENFAVIMHLHFPALNHNTGTLSHVMEDNSTCVTKKLRQNPKVTTFVSAFFCSLLSMTMMCQLGKATESATHFFFSV